MARLEELAAERKEVKKALRSLAIYRKRLTGDPHPPLPGIEPPNGELSAEPLDQERIGEIMGSTMTPVEGSIVQQYAASQARHRRKREETT